MLGVLVMAKSAATRNGQVVVDVVARELACFGKVVKWRCCALGANLCEIVTQGECSKRTYHIGGCIDRHSWCIVAELDKALEKTGVGVVAPLVLEMLEMTLVLCVELLCLDDARDVLAFLREDLGCTASRLRPWPLCEARSSESECYVLPG